MTLKGLKALVICFFVTLFLSCSVSFKGGYRKSHQEKNADLASWFTDTSQILFTTSVDLMKKHFSGLMVFKGTGTDTFRVVMITETGLKVFDFEFIPGKDVMVHYIMEPLNKQVLIRTLSNDIRLLLMNDLSDQRPTILEDKNSGNLVLKFAANGRKAYYFIRPENERPYKVIQAGCFTNKVKGDIFGNSEIDSIKLSHYNIKLAIHLRRIKEEPYVAE